METILIDEKEPRANIVDKVQSINTGMVSIMRKRAFETGLPPVFSGGLMPAPVSESLSLESNLNNLIAAYSGNLAESITFQLDAIKKMYALELVEQYLADMGLIEDFLAYKERKEEHIKKLGN